MTLTLKLWNERKREHRYLTFYCRFIYNRDYIAGHLLETTATICLTSHHTNILTGRAAKRRQLFASSSQRHHTALQKYRPTALPNGDWSIQTRRGWGQCFVTPNASSFWTSKIPTKASLNTSSSNSVLMRYSPSSQPPANTPFKSARSQMKPEAR